MGRNKGYKVAHEDMSLEGSKKIIELPEWIPVLPVRNTVLFPNAAVPLIVGRPKSVKTLELAQKQGDLVLVVTQKKSDKDEPNAMDLFKVGVICLISKIHKTDNNNYQLIANGLCRFQVSEYQEEPDCLKATGVQLPDFSDTRLPRVQSLTKEIKVLGVSILSLAAIPGSEALTKLFNQIEDPVQISDLCCTFLGLPVTTKQELLETSNLTFRLERLLDHMFHEKEKLVLQGEIQAKMMERLSKDQRDHLLREQLKTIHEELGDESNLHELYSRKIEEVGLTEEAKKIAIEELGRLAVIQRASPEYNVVRTYLDWLLSLPWRPQTRIEPPSIDLAKARSILDDDHYGIDRVKKRILQFLSVAKLKNDLKGSVLCLLGPPGVGKTSLGKSIARSLDRAFTRSSLGGVRDEADIRGHRRTYIGAMPGRLIQAMKRAGVHNPVILLDEIDKVGTDFRGDPASALLEVLDPEQNQNFVDHYLDVGFDLSNVFFITTANSLETIPVALRDRLEIIEMDSYSRSEKFEISKRHIWPRLLREHGIESNQVHLTESALFTVIDFYTRESGVRNLTRELANLLRATAEQLTEPDPPSQVTWTASNLESPLGPKRFFIDTAQDLLKPGCVTGLAWTPVGGDILNIEVAQMEGKGKLILTGKLGDVMKESAQIALSLARAQIRLMAAPLGPIAFDKLDFHIHLPSGAIPKDGPSAGAALYVALTSLLMGQPVRTRTAFTGEITLTGNILQVGGIKEKVLAAHRAGIRTVCLPHRNEGDLRDVSKDVRGQLEFHFIREASECLEIAGLKPASLSAPTPFPIPSMTDQDFRQGEFTI